MYLFKNLNIIRQCLGLESNESVLVVTDGLLESGIPEFFAQEAQKATKRVQLVRIKPTGQHGKEPTEETAKIMAESDVVILATYYSLSHTKARKDACQKGARIASVPGITWDTIKRTLVIDYLPVANLSRKIADLLTSAKNARLTNPSGTDLIFSLQGRTAVADTGVLTKPGDFGNLPGGEAFIAPVEGKTEGKLIFDLVYGDHKLDYPLTLTVNKGQVHIVNTPNCHCEESRPRVGTTWQSIGSYRCNNRFPRPQHTRARNDKILSEIMSEWNNIGPRARKIAELGIGTNKAASLKGGLLELEKISGTCHVALGSNIHFGGKVNVPYHVDGLILKPTLILDDKTILKNGKFVV